ncbi:MAG TPA: transglutaminase domain-containing protein, partial [Ignavibacteriaceae bacterium]|nr:transglutaminase domain-containing protein [Ignavibacteriaceae bacterium]
NYKNELDTLPYNLSDFFKTKIIYNELVKNLVYTSDPRASAEYVQFPNETIKLKGGDCDDLSVLFSSVLESSGIETALVDYKADDGIRHVNVLVNTKLNPDEAALITENDTKYFLRKNENSEDEIWIPVETTSLNNFDEAWNAGVEKFNEEAFQKFGLAKRSVEIIDIY